MESCPELSSAHSVFLLEQQESRAEFVESRTQLVRYNARTALPHDRCWSQVCAKELTKYQTAAGPMQTVLGISPRWWEWTTALQEEERCIKWKLTMQSTQCNVAQRNVMQCTPPPGVLVPFTVFLQCVSSLNPKLFCRVLPIKAKLLVICWEYVRLALLPEMSYFSKGSVIATY